MPAQWGQFRPVGRGQFYQIFHVNEHMLPDGDLAQKEDGYVVRIERYYDHPVEKVWEAITSPASIAQWLAHAAIDMREGGAIKFEFINYPDVMEGVITELKPMSVFAYTWKEKNGPDTLVRWELYPDGKTKCRMVLTHTKLGADAYSFGSGWQVHLEMMADAMDGTVTEFYWNEPAWKALDGKYKDIMNALK